MDVNPWEEAAPHWERYRKTIRAMFAPITRALIEDSRIASGHSVLDVATGPGEPALSIAEVVGPTGRIVGIDPASGMIAAAERAASESGLNNARFEVTTADHLPFPADSFDAIVSRFGVMFFPSPIDGVREMLRVLRPKRRMAFAVWSPPERNPFHYVFVRALDRHVPPEPLPPDSPDAFRFATTGKLLNVLNEAGATQTNERVLHFNIEAPVSPEDFWTLRSEMSDRLRTRLADISQDQIAAIRSDVIKDLASYSTGHSVSFPAEVLIVSGAKP
jgi:SAM-dependent methyltransferase